MPADVDQDLPEPEEKQLCTSCAAPNEPERHFCLKCGAPLSSFSTIAPFEHLFAEGFIYREAVERPRRLMTVLGVWLLFGMMVLGTLAGLVLWGRPVTFLAIPIVPISVIMIWKVTRSYMARKKIVTVGKE